MRRETALGILREYENLIGKWEMRGSQTIAPDYDDYEEYLKTRKKAVKERILKAMTTDAER